MVDLSRQIARFVRLPFLHDATANANNVLDFGFDVREGFVDSLMHRERDVSRAELRRRTHKALIQLTVNNIGIVGTDVQRVNDLFDFVKDSSHFVVLRFEIGWLLKLTELVVQLRELTLKDSISVRKRERHLRSMRK